MDESTYYPSSRLLLLNISQAGNIYDGQQPTSDGIIVYSIITPIICAFGIVGNIISLLVLRRRELKGSVYVYLAVLAAVDLCSSILLCISGLSCGVLFVDGDWEIYDVLLGLPLATIFNTMCVLTTIMVTFDRICYLMHPLTRTKPRFCHVHMARRVMIVCFIVSILFNTPYFYVFQLDRDGELIPRPLYFSRFIFLFNWVRFILFGLIPSIYLIFGNGYLIYSLRKLKKMYGKCNNSMKCRKPQNYTNLTVTLILIVFFFLISQIPSMITSRASASTFLFSATNSKDTCNSKTLEIVRQISTVLNALSLSTDFLLYCMFCPAFRRGLDEMWRQKKTVKCVQMNVFVLDKRMSNEKSINELTPGKLLAMMDADGDSRPYSIYDGCSEANNRGTLITLCPQSI